MPNHLDLNKFRDEIRLKVVTYSNLISANFGKQANKKHFKHGVEFVKIVDKILSLYGYLRMD